ncbi:MAG TPA: formate dehydrogenase subunit delta [Steroidobacteraceae bacterium]|jgi:formate dehydrogenase subunit delta
MNIDLLIKMANQIGEFFQGVSPAQAAADVATHLNRYWEPRMRKQIVAYYEERHGAGLTDTALGGIQILKQQADKAAVAAPGAAAPGAKP